MRPPRNPPPTGDEASDGSTACPERADDTGSRRVRKYRAADEGSAATAAGSDSSAGPRLVRGDQSGDPLVANRPSLRRALESFLEAVVRLEARRRADRS